MSENLNKTTLYVCPKRECQRTPLLEDQSGLACKNGHRFAYVTGSKVPVLATIDQVETEYSARDAAIIHDNALRWVFNTFATPETELRKNLVGRLALKPGQRLLVTGAGAGNDLPYLVEILKSGRIYAQDISSQMLLAGFQRFEPLSKSSDVEIQFSLSDATDLPFADRSFDAAYHFGGINFYSNIAKGLSEMARVVKPGGKVVVGDEGLAPWLINTEYGRMLIENNALYASKIPLDQLPATATSVHLSWELGGCFYVIDFVVAESGPKIDIDVPHVGKRGGSIRTRYFGKLEGVDPKLRDAVYAQAEKQGISRVALIESMLKKGLGGE